MTTYSIVSISKHATLAANVVDDVTVAGALVEVANRGTAEIYFRVDGQAPTVGGDDTFVVTPGGALKVFGNGGQTRVRLISSAAVPYSVTRDPSS